MMTQSTDESPVVTIDVSGLPEPVIRDLRQLVDTLRGRFAGPSEVKPEVARKPLRDCLAGQGLTIPTLQDIDDNRREMWSNFPRDLPAQAE